MGHGTMTEATWKVEMDHDRVTISGDAFSFTTNGTDPVQLEAIIADLESAIRGTYGQFCGLSRAADMVGERWGLLIVRDLLVTPKSADELAAGLPKASPKLLARRLTELQYVGVVSRVEPTAEGEPLRYELTEYGRALEETVLAFGRWGAATLAKPRSDEIVTDDSLMVALKATFLPAAATGVHLSYELDIGGHLLHATIDDGRLEVGTGPLPGADAKLELGVALLALMTGETTAADVLAKGEVTVEGDPALLSRFTQMFQLPKLPAPAPLG